MKTHFTDSKHLYKIFVLLYLVIYGILSFSFLELFPLVHSDESWLSGLTRNMAEFHDFSVTEPFFDAWTRYPHAIKILFHSLQMLVLSFADYTVGTVRLISLITGLAVLYFFFLTAEKLLKNTGMAFFFMLLFSFDIQFIYASHFARQEIQILLLIVIAFYLFFRSEHPYTIKQGILLGLLVGIGIGFHPNSFVVACMIGCGLLAYMLHTRCRDIRPLVAYIGISGLFAGIIIAISESFQSDFLRNYFSYGADTFGIDAAAGDRFSSLISFFKRLFLREGGTYYVADIRLQILLFTAVMVMMLFFYFVMREKENTICQNILILLCSAFGIIAGIFIIGRYSQLSIIFLFPIGWLLVALFCSLFEKPIKKGLTIALCVVVLAISVKEVVPFLSKDTYSHYLEQISTFVEPSDKVLGNLNMDFYFENHALMDYRNLPFVMEQEDTLYHYIEAHEFEYIFYTSELSYYYEHRPYYNTIYGNIMFAEDLLRYCEEECEYIGSFSNAYYSPRILELIGNEAYGSVHVYRTKFADKQ